MKRRENQEKNWGILHYPRERNETNLRGHTWFKKKGGPDFSEGVSEKKKTGVGTKGFHKNKKDKKRPFPRWWKKNGNTKRGAHSPKVKNRSRGRWGRNFT